MPTHKKGLIVSISGQAPILIWSMRLKSQVVFIFGGGCLADQPSGCSQLRWGLELGQMCWQNPSRMVAQHVREKLDLLASIWNRVVSSPSATTGPVDALRLTLSDATIGPLSHVIFRHHTVQCLVWLWKNQTVALSMLTTRSLPSGKLT